MSEAGNRPRVAVLGILALALAAAACGGSGGPTRATLVLDFIPNAVHAGIYRALEAGYYEEGNIDLEIVQPTSTADTLKLIDAGKAQFGIADGIDLATQIADGRDAKGIMALLERPAGGLITLKEEGIANPKQLEGRTVGITGVPSDTAVLDTVVGAAGGDPANVDVVTIGFNGVTDLESRRISAFTGFVPADGAQVEHDGYPTRSFPLYEWGGPSYPGLVVFSTRSRIEREPQLMQAFVSATIRGYEDVLRNPEQGIEALVDANPGVNRELAEESLRAYLPLFRGEASRYGIFEPEAIRGLSRFMVENGLSRSPISPGRYATDEFVEGAG